MPSLVQRSDVSEFRKKFRWLVLFIIIAFAILVGRLFILQIVRGDIHDAQARRNIIGERKLATTRVQTGLTDGSQTEIRGPEVKEGMEVISGINQASAESGTTNPFQQQQQQRGGPGGGFGPPGGFGGGGGPR